MPKVALSATGKSPVSHNLVGQRLGRKGRDTRERILSAVERLLAGPSEKPITLSAVAREASLAMTTLYLYFNDLTELLLAVLDPIVASAEETYISQLREPWQDLTLGEHCLSFMQAYHSFWLRHSRILHLRNSFADSGDERMGQHRIHAAWPLIELFIRQMESDPAIVSSPVSAMATVLMTGVERVITMETDTKIVGSNVEHVVAIATKGNALRSRIKDPGTHIRNIVRAQSRILELGIREGRKISRSSGDIEANWN